MHERKVNILCITNKIFTISNEHKAVIMDTAGQADITVTTHSNITDENLSKAEIIFGWPK